ncbi:ligand-binding sensor domain-containing diguanylate cyclase [Dyella monticola]|nr:diguanylate cyclase [Dyella monticola]
MSLASFTQAQGLGSLEDNCLLQDRRGFVYVCTENGLFVFDGHMFQRIGGANGLSGSFISDLHLDANGRLWVGTRTGLYVGDGEHFSVATAPGDSLMIDPGATLTDLDGRLYAVSQHRLWVLEPSPSGWRARQRFDAGALSTTPALSDINSVFADGHALWFGCGKSLCQLSGDHLRVWRDADGIPDDTWTSYLLSRDGTVWARSPRYIRALKPGAAHFVDHDLRGSHVVTAYLDMVQDAQGRVLTRSDTGLARWDGQNWQTFDKHNGLPDVGIDALLYDRSNVLWIGTYGRGVLQWRGYERIQSWQTAQGLDSSPSWAIARASTGALWVGDELGGSMLQPGASLLTPWPVKAPPLAQETIGLYALPGGDMLVAYYSGELLRYHAQAGTTEEIAHSPAYIRHIQMDHLGRIWLCTERGIYLLDGKTLHRVGGTVVPDDVFADAVEDAQNRLWFTSNAGLFRLDNGHWSHVRVVGAPADDSFTQLDVTPAGDLYLAGNFNGLWQGRASDADTVNVSHVGDQLIDTTRIYFINHDRRGWLWIGGTDGVEVFNGQHWRRLTQDDGLVWDDIAEHAFFEDTDGSIWIGTTNGISHIPQPVQLSVIPPFSVVITSVDHGRARQSNASGYRFAYSPSRALTLHLATLDAPTRSTLQYRYRLAGLEQNWVTSERPQVDYPPLRPGHYTFQASAFDPDSRQSSNIVELPIEIVPPWWQRAPAIIAGLLLFVLSLAAIWQLRTRHLHMRAAELARLVAQRTRELEVDKQALEEARAALWHQATHDALTGLINRSHVLDTLNQAVVHAQASGEPLAVALLDLDHFKRINDEFGHLAGDQVLIEAAARLCTELPPGTTLGRYGGEELLAVAPGVRANNTRPFDTLRQCIERAPFRVEGANVSLTCSIGVAWCTADGGNSLVLIRRADAALYTAKTTGRNRVVIATDDDELSSERKKSDGIG